MLQNSMRGMAFIALAVLATSMIVEDATAVDSSEQKDLTQLLSSDQACHQIFAGPSRKLLHAVASSETVRLAARIFA